LCAAGKQWIQASGGRATARLTGDLNAKLHLNAATITEERGEILMSDDVTRCFGNGDPLMEAYHDDEWGVPVHDDRLLFEHLTLDTFQAGLSWRTILHKRENFRRAFDGFDPKRIVQYTDADRMRLLSDAGIVRNRLKIDASISNARACLEIVEEFGSFDRYIWAFTDYKTLLGPPARTWEELPTFNSQSEAMSQDLRERGFKFVGPTICYAFMQAVGMIDDHLIDCFKYRARS
jgi:DNA-3-methyladenine glycosylase I